MFINEKSITALPLQLISEVYYALGQMKALGRVGQYLSNTFIIR